jgi:membrane fusion protein, multidrug efflux system
MVFPSFTPYHKSFVILAIIAFLCSGCKEQKPPGMTPPTVEVVEVVQQDVPVIAEWVATADGYVNAQIKPQVTGYLMRQVYTEGALVKEGDLLFEIDPREFKSTVDQSAGQLEQALAQYAKTQLDVERYTPLAKENAISQQELDNAIAANLAAKAQVDSLKAALENAKLNLSFTKVISPVEGIAGLAQAQVGDLVGPALSSLLTTVSTVNPIKIYFTASEQEYIRFMRENPDPKERRAKEADIQWKLTLADGSIFPHTGKFIFADRQVDVRTGAIRLATEFPNPGNFLRPGQFGRISAEMGRLEGALLVPQRAVTELQGSYQVAVVGTDNKVDIRSVNVGQRYGSLWVIVNGLKLGERVIAEGTQKARQGMPVTPKTAAVEPSTNPPSQPDSNPG